VLFEQLYLMLGLRLPRVTDVKENFSLSFLTDRSVLVHSQTGHEGNQLAEALRGKLPNNYEIRVGLDSVLIVLPSPASELLSQVMFLAEEALNANLSAPAVDSAVKKSLQSGETVIPTRYDGEDLPRVADILGVSIAELVGVHQGAKWRVAMIGFAPGFPYLVADEPNILDSLPRLATPRSQVPLGSVGVAVGMSCIYPSAMPGGWNLLGRTEVPLFDADLLPPALLKAGDIVRFVEVH